LTNRTDSTVIEPSPNIAFDTATPPLMPVEALFTRARMVTVCTPVPTLRRMKLKV